MKKLILLTFCMLMITNVNRTYAAETNTQYIEETPLITARADNIEYKFRILYDGTLQYRRWNATQNRWVDSQWINC